MVSEIMTSSLSIGILSEKVTERLTASSNAGHVEAVLPAFQGRKSPGGAGMPVLSQVPAGKRSVVPVERRAWQTVYAPPSTCPKERKEEWTMTAEEWPKPSALNP